MKNLLIIGSGGHARSVIDVVLIKSQLKIIGVLDLNFKNEQNEDLLGVPVLGGLDCLKKINSAQTLIFLAVGDNKTRHKLSSITEGYGFKSINIIHPKAYVSDSAILGNGNFVGAFSNIGAEAKVGNFCLLNTFSNIEHEVSVGNFCQLGPGAIVCGRSNVSDNVFIGAGGIVKDKISISSGVIVGAGAIVLKSISDINSTYIGVPARKF